MLECNIFAYFSVENMEGDRNDAWQGQRSFVRKDLSFYMPDDINEIECISTIERLWPLYFNSEPTNFDEGEYLIAMRRAVMERWVTLHDMGRCKCGDSDCRTSVRY